MADFARHASAMIQGTEQFSNALNTPDIVTTPLTGLPDAFTHIFHFVGGASREGLTWARDGVNQTVPTTNHIIFGIWFRFSDLSPTTEYVFCALSDNGGRTVLSETAHSLSFVLETDGDVRVRDNNDATIATIADPFTVDTHHRLEFRFLPDTTTDPDNGEVQIWLDGVEILSNQTVLDLSTYGVMDFIMVGGSPTSGESVYFAGAYAIVNSAAASDRLDADFEIVGPYSIGQTGASPDNNGDNDGTPDTDGDDLDGDGALWETTAEIPFSDETQDTDLAEYDGTPLDGSCYCDGGTRGGPSGDGDVDGDSNIKSAQYTFRAERGTGGGTTHSFYFGNQTDAGGSAGKHVRLITTGPVNYTVVSENAAVMPLSSQNARMGFGVAGAQNMYMHEMVCTLLHVPSAGPPPETEFGLHAVEAGVAGSQQGLCGIEDTRVP